MVLDALEDVDRRADRHLRAARRTRTRGTSRRSQRAVKEIFNVEMTLPAPPATREDVAGADLPGRRRRSTSSARRSTARSGTAFCQLPLPRDHRPAVEGPPAGDGPPAPGHRPARLRPEGPEAGVQEGGLRRASSRCWRPSRPSSSAQMMRAQPRDAHEDAERAAAADGAAPRQARRGPRRAKTASSSQAAPRRSTGRRARARRSAATTRAPAAAARSTRSATAPPKSAEGRTLLLCHDLVRRAPGPQGTWSAGHPGPQGTWSAGHLVRRAPGPLGTWSRRAPGCRPGT